MRNLAHPWLGENSDSLLIGALVSPFLNNLFYETKLAPILTLSIWWRNQFILDLVKILVFSWFNEMIRALFRPFFPIKFNLMNDSMKTYTYGQFIDIDLDELNVGELGGHGLDHRLYELAGPTPRCREIHHHLHKFINTTKRIRFRNSMKISTKTRTL